MNKHLTKGALKKIDCHFMQKKIVGKEILRQAFIGRKLYFLLITLFGHSRSREGR